MIGLSYVPVAENAYVKHVRYSDYFDEHWPAKRICAAAPRDARPNKTVWQLLGADRAARAKCAALFYFGRALLRLIIRQLSAARPRTTRGL